MVFTPKTDWKDGDLLPAADVNRIEQGIADASGPVSYNDLTNKPALLQIGTTASTAKAGNYVPTWAEVTGKPTTFAPIIGTTATTAKAGDYVPAWGDVTGKPTTFTPTIGATATTAAAGNHNHAVTADAASGLAAAATIQALAVALSARIKALEDAATAP